MKTLTKRLILYTLVGSIVFGIIDASIFLGVEENLNSWLLSFNAIDNITSPLVVGGLSASISLFICNTINRHLRNKYKLDLIESSLLDALGILIGTSIVILFYYMFMQHRYNEKHEDNK